MRRVHTSHLDVVNGNVTNASIYTIRHVSQDLDSCKTRSVHADAGANPDVTLV